MQQPTLRPFVSADLAPLVALWNRCLTKDPITEERFWRLFLLDPNFDPEGALVAEVGGELVGFLQVQAAGYLTVFFVVPEWRRQGIGTRLLEAGLAYLAAKGRTRVSCNGYAPYYVFPGVDVDYTEALAFLLAKGFTVTSEPVAMGMALEGVRMPEAVCRRRDGLALEGYTVRLFARHDTLALLAFVKAQFPHWYASVLDGLQRGNEELIIAEKAGELVGFTQWQNPHNDPPHGAPGRFGPFGVHPALQSQGIGAVIFYTLIEHATASGARYLWFGWAGGRNLRFYERAGCRITRRFQILAREV